MGSQMIGRRGFLTGLSAIVASPAIVRASSLMPIKPVFEAGELSPELAGRLTLMDWARRVNPPVLADIKRLFAETDAILADMPFTTAPGSLNIVRGTFRPLEFSCLPR